MNFSLKIKFQTSNLKELKVKMLNWVNQFSIFTYLDNNLYPNLRNRYELLIGADALEQYFDLNALSKVFAKEWLFGHFNYDLKNQLYTDLVSEKTNYFQNEVLHFFKASIVIYIPFGSNELHILSNKLAPEIIFDQITKSANTIPQQGFNNIKFEKTMHKESYLNAVEKVKNHIIAGDCYELNLCLGSWAKLDNKIPITTLFHQLNTSNPAPFAALYQYQNFVAICSSPERFLYKNKEEIVAQPMKGTIKRGTDATSDETQKLKLRNDIKECAENLMIVDLMRNDLAKTAKTSSVKVLELLGVYTFPSLHTMISTISAQSDSVFTPLEILLKAFPMGSMTGAPKKIVMELIESLEASRRSLYSGSIGYCSPDGNFDFNVVIRSLLLDTTSNILSFHTGGAITIDSIPEKEWEEIALKAQALMKIMGNN